MIKIGIAQMNSQDDKASNLEQAGRLIDQLAAEDARFIMLPEYFHFLGPDEIKADNAETMSGPSMELIRDRAVKHRAWIHWGSILEKDGARIYNTSVVVDPQGEIIAKYRKIHLFDVETPGGIVYKESATITPGAEAITFSIEGMTFGMSVCYDLRFPELYRRLTRMGAQVLLVPAAFTLQTGRDHWELLLKARAVENLCWVLAAGQWGPHPPNHTTFGRSMVINPWGLVVAMAPDGVSTASAVIDPDTPKKHAHGFPCPSTSTPGYI